MQTGIDFTARCIAAKALESSGSAFEPTQTQLDAMNSGITAADVQQINTNKTNISLNWLRKRNLLDLSLATEIGQPTGVTYTINADKSVTITATELASAQSLKFKNIPNIGGTLVLSGIPSGGGLQTYFADIQQSNTTVPSMTTNDSGNGSNAFTIPEGAFEYRVRIAAGSRTFTVYPMICTESDWLQNKQYQPYAMSNAELTAAIQAIQAQLANS